MSEWKSYRRVGWLVARPYVSGEDLSRVSVSTEDRARGSLEGGMIARNPDNENDKWYIAPEFFATHYVAHKP